MRQGSRRMPPQMRICIAGGGGGKYMRWLAGCAGRWWSASVRLQYERHSAGASFSAQARCSRKGRRAWNVQGWDGERAWIVRKYMQSYGGGVWRCGNGTGNEPDRRAVARSTLPVPAALPKPCTGFRARDRLSRGCSGYSDMGKREHFSEIMIQLHHQVNSRLIKIKKLLQKLL